MALDYKTVKALTDAQTIVARNRGLSPTKIGDRTYELTDYNCPRVIYSQQEITIHPWWETRYGCDDRAARVYPGGVRRISYSNPLKEYVAFHDAGGTARFYLVPEEGLRIQRDGEGYKAMNAPQDYHIEVDRAKAKEARKPAEELYDAINILWDMIPEPEDWDDRSYQPQDFLPAIAADREAWYAYVLAAKYPKYGSLSKAVVLGKIRQHYTDEALAFSITRVPDTRTDHTEHWGRIDELRRAGALLEFEGRQRRKKG
jgi:hypothetical protein